MSSAHHHPHAPGIGRAAFERVMNNPEIREAMSRLRNVNRDYDLPYVGGYSTDGATIYIDRHLPEEIEAEYDGREYHISTTQDIVLHEQVEKALIDVLGWGYAPAHRVAQFANRRQMLARGIPWEAETKAFAPYVKADEHERLIKVPADLDLTPYLAPPVNRRLLAHLQSLMGGEKRRKKEEVHYTDKGTPAEHCGPDWEWMKGNCRNYQQPHQCRKVLGYIDVRGWCDLWVAARKKEKVA